MLCMRFITAALLVINVVGLNNGLARIPDRGWNSVRVLLLAGLTFPKEFYPSPTHPHIHLAAVLCSPTHSPCGWLLNSGMCLNAAGRSR